MTARRSVLMLVAAACLGAACETVQGTETDSKPARPVRAQAVTAAAASTAVRYSATIEPFAQVSLAFKSSGYVDDVLRRQGVDGRTRVVQPGDRIGRGTVLARVNDSDYRQRVEQARARLADSEVAQRKARLDLDRARTLFEADSLTKPEIDAAQAAFDSADARIASARADVEMAMNALRDCALTAPAAGVLLERRIERGTLVGTSTIGFVLGDMSSVKARFGIPDAMVQSVRLGDEIRVLVEALAWASLPGRITAIAPAADVHSRVFDVEVTVPNADGRLRPGMIGTVALDPTAAAAAPTVLTVPLTAIVRAEAGSSDYAVFVAERKGDVEFAHLRRVQLGEVAGNGIAVRDGLKLGERVIVSGATLLADGEAIRVIP